MKMIGNVSDWLSYAGGALIKVADSAGSTVISIGNGALFRPLRHTKKLLARDSSCREGKSFCHTKCL